MMGILMTRILGSLSADSQETPKINHEDWCRWWHRMECNCKPAAAPDTPSADRQETPE